MKQEDYPEEIKALLKFGTKRTPGPGESEVNDTMPLDLVGIEHLPKACEDCGDIVVNRTINIKKNQQPILYWRKECSICKQCEHPITKDFSLNSVELRALLRTLHLPPPIPGKGRPSGAKNKAKNADNDK